MKLVKMMFYQPSSKLGVSVGKASQLSLLDLLLKAMDVDFGSDWDFKHISICELRGVFINQEQTLALECVLKILERVDFVIVVCWCGWMALTGEVASHL